ncbi:Unknown protein, partial [Striga hermonthica]
LKTLINLLQNRLKASFSNTIIRPTLKNKKKGSKPHLVHCRQTHQPSISSKHIINDHHHNYSTQSTVINQS